MQRRARRARTCVIGAALAMALTGSLTACSGGSDGDGGDDTKPGDSSAASGPAPGKYQTLPEPCGTIHTGTLKGLLPGAEGSQGGGDSSDSGRGATTSPYQGEPSVTYDTDRRVGCHWKSATSMSTRHLSVDLERVVSYDSSTSDDEQAGQLYTERASQAGIPGAGDDASKDDGGSDDGGAAGSEKSDSGSGRKTDDESGKKTQDAGKSGEDGAGSGSDKDGSTHKKTDGGSHGKDADQTPDPDRSASDSDKQSDKDADGDSDSGSPSPDDDLSPRTLDDIGDNAYINDQLDTGDSGVHRDITLVFRSANVIATVKYDQWLNDKGRTPDSAELQEKARKVAQELASDFDDS